MSDRGIPLRAKMAAAVIDASPEWSVATMARAMGAAARWRLPRPMSRIAARAYARYFGVEVGDVDPTVWEEGFDSFDAFFTRRLRAGARAIDRLPESVISPCDGTLREVVALERSSVVEAKHHGYTLDELLVDPELAERFAGGHLASIYLHPRDYHRVHSPTEAMVRRVVLVPGRLLPVTDAALAREPALFSRNERLIHVLETPHGLMAVVMVAAFGVGNMSCAYHRFDAHPRAIQVHERESPVRLRKGDELGAFHLGSTVLLLTEAGPTPTGRATPSAVRLGEPLFRGRIEA